MQASLPDYPPTDPPEATYRDGALNAVGVALLIKGKILMEQGDTPGARETLDTLVSDFEYAQYQDSADMNRWVRPAELARRMLVELQADMN